MHQVIRMLHDLKQNLFWMLVIIILILLSPLGRVEVSFKQSEYTVRESDGRVAITVKADRRSFYGSFYVKIRANVNTDLRPYGTYKALKYSYEFFILFTCIRSYNMQLCIYTCTIIRSYMMDQILLCMDFHF